MSLGGATFGMEVWARAQGQHMKRLPVQSCRASDLLNFREARPSTTPTCNINAARISVRRKRTIASRVTGSTPNCEPRGPLHVFDTLNSMSTPLAVSIRPTDAVGSGTVIFPELTHDGMGHTTETESVAPTLSAAVGVRGVPECDCDATDARLQHQIHQV